MWIRKAQRDLIKGVDSPIPTQVVSNEEFIPRPQNHRQKRVEHLIGRLAEEKSPKLTGGFEVGPSAALTVDDVSVLIYPAEHARQVRNCAARRERGFDTGWPPPGRRGTRRFPRRARCKPA